MTDVDRVQLKQEVAELKSVLETGAALNKALAEHARRVDGAAADELVFRPLMFPTVDQTTTPYSAWLARVDAILGK